MSLEFIIHAVPASFPRNEEGEFKKYIFI